MNTAKNNTQLPQSSVSVSVTDVRYGNLINHVSFGTVPIRGIAIDGLKTEYKDSFYWDDVKYHTGIPITEELLLKLGFEVIYRSNFTLRLDHKENFKFGARWNLVNGHFHIRFIGEQFANIKCIHELQNLYFSITGSELQIVSLTEH